MILKFIWTHKRPQIVKAILSKTNKAIRIKLPISKYTTKAIINLLQNKLHKKINYKSKQLGSVIKIA
jgi:phosphoketolase